MASTTLYLGRSRNTTTSTTAHISQQSKQVTRRPTTTRVLKKHHEGETKQQAILASVQNKSSRIPVVRKSEISNPNQHAAGAVQGQRQRKTVGGGGGGGCKTTAGSENVVSKSTKPVEVTKAEVVPVKTKQIAVHLPPVVRDADEGDTDAQLCAEYLTDIYNYLLCEELSEKYVIRTSFLGNQMEIGDWHRRILVDWLVQVQQKFSMLNETLFLTVDILDRFLQAHNVTKDRLQLVGIAAMFIACKYEEIYPLSIKDFTYITDNTYTTREVREMEKRMLRTLRYFLNKPLPLHFLRRYSKVADADVVEHNLAKYILELALLDANLSPVSSSEKAAASFLLARTVYRQWSARKAWTPALAHYSAYKLKELTETRDMLMKVLKEGHGNRKFKIVTSKYSEKMYACVSDLPALNKL